MVVQIVQFQLAGISPEQYEAEAERIAPKFAHLPGLIAKAWLRRSRREHLRRRLPAEPTATRPRPTRTASCLQRPAGTRPSPASARRSSIRSPLPPR